MSYLEVFKGSSLKLTTNERFKVSFSTCRTKCLPSQPGSRKRVWRQCHHMPSPFIPSNPKAGQTVQEISCIRIHVTATQQEVNLNNHIHPTLAVYKRYVLYQKSSQGENLIETVTQSKSTMSFLHTGFVLV